MKKTLHTVFCIAALLIFTVNAEAVISITVYDSANSGITSLSWSINNRTIDIYETWTRNAYGFLLIDLGPDVEAYTVNKHITNLTGFDWVGIANELLDPLGGDNPNDPDDDDSFDVTPYPSWVPSGYTTSNDGDRLDFGQGFGIPRTSTTFDNLFTDEAGDARDFLYFYNNQPGGNVLPGDGTVVELMSYGLHNEYSENTPFLLAQRFDPLSDDPTIPEPTTLLLVGLSGIGLGFLRKKRI